ncbi:MAG: FUSC family protein [Parvibaculaceae bacterium]|nr:FUSC family protein [Parvibaculaceae bacterium]
MTDIAKNPASPAPRSRAMFPQYARQTMQRGLALQRDWLPIPAGWPFAARTTLAGLLALYVAYTLQLDTPYSAMTTVLIVSNPVRGMILSKSIYRFLGTLVGAVASIVLLELFSQTPVLFFTGFALWLGLCTTVATLLRHFRSYAAVLAGYTVSLVAFSAAATPDQTFQIISGRISVVSVGIVCSAVVSALFAGSGATNDLKKRLLKLSQDLIAYMDLSLFREPGIAHVPERRAAANSIIQINDLIEFAATESGEIEQRRRALRAALAALPGTLAEAPFVGGALSPADHALLGPGSHRLETTADVERLRQDVRARIEMKPETEAQDLPQTASALVRLDALLDRLLFALTTLEARTPTPGDYRAAIFHHRDYRTAVKNGVRAALAVSIASVFWVMTAWNTGALLMSLVGPLVSMLATRDRPELASIDFMKGIVLSTFVGFIFSFAILPHIDGFPLLACAFGVVLFIGAWIMSVPQYAGMAAGFLIFFVTLVAVGNPMKFDVEGYLDNAMILVLGAVFTVVAFQTILPDSPERNVKRLSRSIRHDLGQLINSAALPDLTAYEQNTHSLLIRLSELTAATPDARPMLDGGIAALRIGQEIIWARRAIVETGLIDPDLRAHFRRLSVIDGNPHEAAVLAVTLSARVEAIPSTDPQHRAAFLRAAQSMREVSDQIRERAYFFVKNGGLSNAHGN